MAIMTRASSTPIAAYRPRPPRSAQRARDIGVDRSISSRPSVSSEAQPSTRVAVAKPARMSPNVMNASWRNAPAPDSRSICGNAAWKIASVSGERPCSVSLNDGAAAPNTKPIRPMPIPHQNGERQPLAERARERPAEAQRERRQSAATGSACTAPRSRRANATTPTANSDDGEHDGRDERRPVEAADERLVVDGPAPPGQVRERREGRRRVLVAVGEVAEQEDGARRSPPTAPRPDERGQRERDGSRRQRDDADPQAEPERPTSTRSRRPGSVPNVPATYVQSGRDEDDDRHPGEVRGELLERDPALAERRRRDELEAARAGPRSRASRTAPGPTTGAAIRPSDAAVFQAIEPPSVSIAVGNGLP